MRDREGGNDWENFATPQTLEEGFVLPCTVIIAGFKEPATDEAEREELADFVARRNEEGGAPADF